MNQLLYDFLTLLIDGVNAAECKLVSFQGEMALSSYYSFDVTFIYPATTPLLAENLLNVSAQLSFAEVSGSPILEGMVTAFQQKSYLSTNSHSDATDYIEYSITIAPVASVLLQSQHTQFFTAQTLKTIINTITAPYNFIPVYKLELPQNKTLPQLPFIFQFEEIDANFIARLLEKFGMFFYFEFVNGVSTMVITDSSTALKLSTVLPSIHYQTNPAATDSEMDPKIFMSLVKTNIAPPSKVIVKGYDYQNASKQIIATVYAADSHKKIDQQQQAKQVKASGSATSKVGSIKANASGVNKSASTVSSGGPAGYVVEKWVSSITKLDKLTALDVAQALANVIMGSYKAAAEIVEIEIAANYLLPGDVIGIAGYKIKDVNQKYLVTKIVYDLNFSKTALGTFGAVTTSMDDTAVCQVTLIPFVTPYHQPLTTEMPRISGFIPAIVTGSTPGEVHLDDQGEYIVRLPVANNETSMATCSIRKMEPSLYNRTGSFYPLVADTEVLLAFQDGNPDVPIIIGAIGNSLNQPLVTQSNQHHSGVVYGHSTSGGGTSTSGGGTSTSGGGGSSGLLNRINNMIPPGSKLPPPPSTTLAIGSHLSVHNSGYVASDSPNGAGTGSGSAGSTTASSSYSASLSGTYTGQWNPGQYHFNYDGSPGNEGIEIHYPNGSYLALTKSELVHYHTVDSYHVYFGNTLSATLGDVASITIGNSTSTVVGNRTSTTGSSTNYSTSNSLVYGDSDSTMYGNRKTTMGSASQPVVNSTTTHGQNIDTTYGDVKSTTHGNEISITEKTMSSVILGASNTIMVGEGSFIFLGLNMMVTIIGQISMNAGYKIDANGMGDLHLGLLYNRVVGLLSTKTTGATVKVDTPASTSTLSILDERISALQTELTGMKDTTAGEIMTEAADITNAAAVTTTLGEVFSI